MEAVKYILGYTFTSISVGWYALTTILEYLPTEVKVGLATLVVSTNPVLFYSIFLVISSIVGQLLYYSLLLVRFLIEYIGTKWVAMLTTLKQEIKKEKKKQNNQTLSDEKFYAMKEFADAYFKKPSKKMGWFIV